MQYPKEVENTLLYTEQYLLGTKDDSSSNTSYISKMTICDRLSENRPSLHFSKRGEQKISIFNIIEIFHKSKEQFISYLPCKF